MRVIPGRSDNWTLWKNGGGLTREVAIYPAGSSLDDFIWRVSLAKIECSGPFSRFENTHRTLLLLQGRGAVFQFEGHDQTLSEVHQSFCFSGDDALYCRLIDGPCLVLNVMVRPGWNSRLCVDQFEIGPKASTVEPLEIETRGACWGDLPTGGSVDLQLGDAVFLAPNHLCFLAGAAGSGVVRLDICFSEQALPEFLILQPD